MDDTMFECIEDEEIEDVADIDEPPLYKVILLNDDYTTMEFVVNVLKEVFHKTLPEATRIMLLVHHTGSGLCGTYPKEIAETKIEQVHSLARGAGFPLKAIMEKE